VEKLKLTRQNILTILENSNDSLYTDASLKELKDHGNGNGNALFIKAKRKSDGKIFYTIILSEDNPKYLAEEKDLKKRIDKCERSLNQSVAEFKEYLPETFYTVKDIDGCVSTLSTESDTPIDWIFNCFDSEEESIKLEIRKQEFYPDQVYEMGEWYASFYKEFGLEFYPYEMEKYYKIQDEQNDLSPMFCDMSVSMGEMFQFFGDLGKMVVRVEETEISPEEAYQLPEWEG